MSYMDLDGLKTYHKNIKQYIEDEIDEIPEVSATNSGLATAAMYNKIDNLDNPTTFKVEGEALVFIK